MDFWEIVERGSNIHVWFALGSFAVAFLGLFVRWAVFFVGDKEYKAPKFLSDFDKEKPHVATWVPLILWLLCGLLAALVWPLAYLALITVAILFVLRYVARIKRDVKSIVNTCKANQGETKCHT